MPRSKRRSGSKRDSSSELLRVFIDRSLGKRTVPSRLRRIHADVVVHDELFTPDAPDQEWLSAAGEGGWVVLTRDDRIRYRPAEQAAILSAGVRCFCLNPTGGLTANDMAEILAAALPRILRIAAAEAGGYVKGINRHGAIRHMYPK